LHVSAFDVLDFVDGFRAGGPDQQPRRSYDYTINGTPLRSWVNAGDNIGLFGWLPHESEAEFARWLLMREPSKLPSGRVPLYICPECGDLGCQSRSARVIETDDAFVWTELGYEAEYDTGPVTKFIDARPFCFEKRAYERAVGRFAK
jgi:hypothetical protein